MIWQKRSIALPRVLVNVAVWLRAPAKVHMTDTELSLCAYTGRFSCDKIVVSTSETWHLVWKKDHKKLRG